MKSKSCKHLGISYCYSRELFVNVSPACFPPFISIYKFRFQDINKAHTWLWLGLYSKAFQRVGFFFSFVFSAFHLAQPGCFIPSFPESSSTSWQSFQCRHYLLLPIYYCSMAGSTASWKINEHFLAVLCSALLFICFPYPVALSPVPRTFFFPTISCLFVCLVSPVLLLQFVKPQPQTHTSWVTLPLVIKAIAILTLL